MLPITDQEVGGSIPSGRTTFSTKTVLSLELLTGSSGLELPRVVQIRTQGGVEGGVEPSLVSGVGHRLW